MLAGLNDRFVMVASFTTKLFYDLVIDFLVSSFSFLLTYLAYNYKPSTTDADCTEPDLI